jgi:hypothetical protein
MRHAFRGERAVPEVTLRDGKRPIDDDLRARARAARMARRSDDSNARSVSLGRRDEGMVKTRHGDVTVNAEPFDAFALDLTVLWERLPSI